MVDSLKSNPTPLYYTYARAYDSLHQDQIALEYYLKFYKESKESDNILGIEKATKLILLIRKLITVRRHYLTIKSILLYVIR